MQSSNTTPQVPSQLAVLGNSSARVSAHNGTLTVGGINDLGWSDVRTHWWPQLPWELPVPQRHYHYTTIGTTYPVKPNPMEAAFKITAKLIEKGMVEEMTVKKFVETVNDIAEIIRQEV